MYTIIDDNEIIVLQKKYGAYYPVIITELQELHKSTTMEIATLTEEIEELKGFRDTTERDVEMTKLRLSRKRYALRSAKSVASETSKDMEEYWEKIGAVNNLLHLKQK